MEEKLYRVTKNENSGFVLFTYVDGLPKMVGNVESCQNEDYKADLAKDEKIASLTKLIEDIKEMNKILIGNLSAEIRTMNREVETYEEAARVIALWLKEFCDYDLNYPAMIADAARRASKEIDRLRSAGEQQEVKDFLLVDAIAQQLRSSKRNK